MLHRSRHRSTSRAKRGVLPLQIAVRRRRRRTHVCVPGAVSRTLTPSDPNVNVSGGAGCHAFAFASSISFALDNGETASAAFSLFSYKVAFHNIAPNGTSGTATVTCGGGASAYTYTRAVSINRPQNGNHITLNFPCWLSKPNRSRPVCRSTPTCGPAISSF